MSSVYRFMYNATTRACYAWLVVASLHAQAQTQATSLVKVNMLSPEAASLGKFGNVPVSNFTGVPNISIPVYTIKVADIEFPVSLDYHAGGIRVEEAASSVGIGWALNATRIITRNMVGLPDESYDYFGSPEPSTVTANPSSYQNYLFALAGDMGSGDSQPDIYHYSTSEAGGKFLFKRDGSVYQIPVTNNKISTVGSGYFEIVEPNGIKALYEEKRRTSSSVVSDPSYINTWCLTKLISSNLQDTIYFKYDPVIRTSFTRQVMSRQNFGAKFVESDGTGNPINSFSVDMGSESSSVTISNQQYYPTEIAWRGGKIIFNYASDRIDLSADLRLDEVRVFSAMGNTYSLIKYVKLHQSTVSTPVLPNTIPADVEKFSRLRLDSVSFRDPASSNSVELYRLAYNDIKLPNRGSFAQDRWGFYNGHDENYDLMPKQKFYFLGIYYDFGSANRDTDVSKIQAGMISSIQYPTKGKSVFEFEPHQFQTQLQPTQVKSLIASICCTDAATYQQNFTVNTNSSKFRFRAFISKYNYSGVTDRPRYSLTDLTTGTLVCGATSMTPDADSYSNDNGMFSSFGYPNADLVQGHTYQIKLERFTTTANVTVRFELNWDEIVTGGSDITYGGGVRVRSITNYDVNGNFVNKDVYSYGVDGAGYVITPWFYQSLNYEQTKHRFGSTSTGYGGCYYFTEGSNGPSDILYPGYSTTFISNGVLPTTQFGGSPVVYPTVTVYSVDHAGVDNGKTEYTYSLSQDSSPPPLYYFGTGSSSNVLGDILLQSDEWKNGVLVGKKESKRLSTGAYLVVKNTQNTMTPSYLNTYSYLKLKKNYVHSGCLILNVSDYTLPVNDIRTGAMIPTASASQSSDDSGNTLSSSKNYTYGSTPLLPSSIVEVNSKGETLTQNLKYPRDFSATGNVYEKMVNRNILTPVIQEQKLKNGNPVSLTTVNYLDWFGNSNLLLPQSVDVQNGTGPTETRVYFNSYDKYGNILQQQKSNDVRQSYLWDYKSIYPVATVINADASAIAYTSFESDGQGGWTYTPNPNTTQARTGSRCHNLSSTIQRTGLSAALRYKISYWYKDGTPALSGATATSVYSYVHASGWTYWEGLVTGVTSLSLGGTGVIDELRLYPEGAQMSTFTYTPLVGMTSSADANNVVSFFEYDSFGRLQAVRDDKGNIVKTYQYNYILD